MQPLSDLSRSSMTKTEWFCEVPLSIPLETVEAPWQVSTHHQLETQAFQKGTKEYDGKDMKRLQETCLAGADTHIPWWARVSRDTGDCTFSILKVQTPAFLAFPCLL